MLAAEHAQIVGGVADGVAVMPGIADTRAARSVTVNCTIATIEVLC